MFYNELRVAPEEHPVVMCESPTNCKANREKTTQILFETFSVPATHIASTATTAIMMSGRKDGLIVDLGAGVSHVVGVVDGRTVPQTVTRLDIGGHDLTDYLSKQLNEFETSAEFSIGLFR